MNRKYLAAAYLGLAGLVNSQTIGADYAPQELSAQSAPKKYVVESKSSRVYNYLNLKVEVPSKGDQSKYISDLARELSSINPDPAAISDSITHAIKDFYRRTHDLETTIRFAVALERYDMLNAIPNKTLINLRKTEFIPDYWDPRAIPKTTWKGIHMFAHSIKPIEQSSSITAKTRIRKPQ